jgi:hypothetical protein
VIGIESGFNPFSQSVVGAQGLMQVMPRFHKDKLPRMLASCPSFDPLTNVQVGAKVLKESIHRTAVWKRSPAIRWCDQRSGSPLFDQGTGRTPAFGTGCPTPACGLIDKDQGNV